MPASRVSIWAGSKIAIFPGKAFVGYQSIAQRMAPDAFVLSIGDGERWPGYTPTTRLYAIVLSTTGVGRRPAASNAFHDALEKVIYENQARLLLAGRSLIVDRHRAVFGGRTATGEGALVD